MTDPDLERREFLAWCGRGAAVVAGASLLGCPTPGQAQDSPAAGTEAPPPARPAPYVAREFPALRGLSGITDEQVAEHLKLYQGYVKRTNELLARLGGAPAAPDATWQELKRRCGWEWNGMRLHELYFEGLKAGAAPLADDHPFAKAVAELHGSLDAWRQELLATAKLPGVGWVIVTRDPGSGQLLTTWVETHEEGHLAGCAPLLVLDVWEHAFTVYRKPTERAGYLEDWLANVDWAVVASRMSV